MTGKELLAELNERLDEEFADGPMGGPRVLTLLDVIASRLSKLEREIEELRSNKTAR